MSSTTITRPVAQPTRPTSTRRATRPVVAVPQPRDGGGRVRDYGPWDD